MNSGLPLIITRPEPGASASLARAVALGLDARKVPLFAARAVAWVVPDVADFDALLLTSAQAPRLAGDKLARLLSLPAYAVGAATAAAARAAGLTIAATGDAGVQPLLDAMTSEKCQKILWLCGRDRTSFDARDVDLVAVACYAVDAVEPSPVWADAIATPAVVLAHSSRATTRINALVGDQRRHLALVAISAAAASSAGEGWSAVAIADSPDDVAMLALAGALCHKGKK